MHPCRRAPTLAFAASILALPAAAQQPPGGGAAAADPVPVMPGMPTGPGMAPASSGSADQAMMAGMEKMNRDMGHAPMTGDADRDFVAMMLPHHQGAIEMARVELQYGKDPELRRLARDIVAAQEAEIEGMRRWQQNHPPKPGG